MPAAPPPPTGDADQADEQSRDDGAGQTAQSPQKAQSAQTAQSARSERSPSETADRQRAADALRAAFARLAPQGSDEWNFLAAFTHLGDRYGPYHPGASALSDALEDQSRTGARRSGRRGRLRRGGDRAPGAPEGAPNELEEAMGHVVEAFRFLSARVATLEGRLAAQDRPVEGAAWLVPADPLGSWAGPVAAHLLARTPGGDLVHADCGEGELLGMLTGRGARAHGVEPRGAVALRALEHGFAVTIAEASEHLAGLPEGSLGGVALNGVVDRLPLHALLSLLGQCRRTLGRDAPLVVVAERPAAAGSWEAPALDLVQGRPVHEATWELLLDRAGFVEVAPLDADAGDDRRFALAAVTPS